MTLLIFLVLFIVIVAFTILLPSISGVGSFKIDREALEKKDTELTEDEPRAVASGYVPPDEFMTVEEDETQTKSPTLALKEKLENVTIPILFQTATDQKLRKRRNVSAPSSPDPNVFDYDIDEMIEEDARAENEARLEELQEKIKGLKSPKLGILG